MINKEEMYPNYRYRISYIASGHSDIKVTYIEADRYETENGDANFFLGDDDGEFNEDQMIGTVRNFAVIDVMKVNFLGKEMQKGD